MILWHSYPTQIPRQSCNLGSLRKQRTDHLQISSVYYESVPMPCVIPVFFCLIRQNIRESDCTSEVCALSGEGRSRFCRDTPCSQLCRGDSTSIASPFLTLCFTSPRPTLFSLANFLWQSTLRLSQSPLGQDCFNSNGYRESLRSGRTCLPGNLHVPWMNPFLVLWRSSGTKSLHGIGQNFNDIHPGTLARW